jgi:tetratricopeptide (TPR) repeat protein
MGTGVLVEREAVVVTSTRGEILKPWRTLGLVAVALAATASLADAQLAVRRPTERVLFLIPAPAEPSDSNYAVQFANEARKRMESKLRNSFVTIPSDQICELLRESGYPCNAILGSADAERLARHFRSDAYIEGEITRNSGPQATLHLVDLGRSGLSGWVHVAAPGELGPKEFAELVVDSLDRQSEAARHARECLEERDRGDYRDALDRAQRAFRIYPNHPSSAMCASVVFEAMQAPVDSQIVMLERAIRGDSLMIRALERVARLYIQAGDSAKAIEASERQLAAKPNDRQLWRAVIAGQMTLGNYTRARELLDEWLAGHPDDAELRQLKIRACVEGELWLCALQELAAQYERDSSLVGDTAFYGTIIGAAQSVNDNEALLQWTYEASSRLPDHVPFLRAHAGALQAAGMTDSMVAVYDRILQRDPQDVTSMLAAAQALLDNAPIDSVTPLDTTRLNAGKAYLDRLVASTRDTSLLLNASVRYAQTGIALMQRAQRPNLAIPWLEATIATDVGNGRLAEQASFFLGIALLPGVYQLDEQARAAESCRLVNEEAQRIARAKTLLTRGRNVAPQAADQYLEQYNSLERDRIPQLRAAFKCQ